MDHVRSLAGEVTVVAITHRTGVIRPADAVIRLQGGRLAAQRAAHPQFDRVNR